MSFPDYRDLAQVLSYRATGTGTANEQLEYLASLRGRAGYAMGAWTPFVTGGIAWASTRYSRTDLTTGNEDASPAISGWATCWAAASTIVSIHAGRRGPNISTPTSA